MEIDPSLEVGGNQETVTVTADAGVIESTTASMGQVVDARRVSELPTPHGDPFFLIGLAGGTTFGAAAVGGRDVKLDRPFEPTHITGYSIDGTRPNRGDVTIDGAPSTSVANAFEVTASYVPPTDIIQEVKVQTASFDAQFGNTEGGVTNIVIKSGTNDINGSAYWVKMPVVLSANDFHANRTNTARPSIPLRPSWFYSHWSSGAAENLQRTKSHLLLMGLRIHQGHPDQEQRQLHNSNRQDESG